MNKVNSTIWGNEILGYFDGVRDIMVLRCVNSTMKSVMDDAIGIYHGVLVANIEEIEENLEKLKSEHEVLFEDFNKVLKAEIVFDFKPFIRLSMSGRNIDRQVLEVICLVLKDNPHRYVEEDFIFSRGIINSMLNSIPDEPLLQTIQSDTAIPVLKSQSKSPLQYNVPILRLLNWLFKYLDLVEEIHLAPDIYQSIMIYMTQLRNFRIIRRQLDAYYIKFHNRLLRL